LKKSKKKLTALAAVTKASAAVAKVKAKKNSDTLEELTNSDVYRVLGGLAACQTFKGRHFSYMLATNGRRIEEHTKKIEDSIDVSDGLKEFREKLTDLNMEKAEHELKNELKAGSPTPFDKKIKELKLKHKDDIDKYDEDRKEMLEESVFSTNKKFSLDKIKLSLVPEEITGAMMNDIFECIDHGEE